MNFNPPGIEMILTFVISLFHFQLERLQSNLAACANIAQCLTIVVIKGLELSMSTVYHTIEDSVAFLWRILSAIGYITLYLTDPVYPFLPFIGSFLSALYPTNEYLVLGSFLMSCIILIVYLLRNQAYELPRKMTSKEYRTLLKKIRKERSYRRRMELEYVELLMKDPLRDPKARRRRFKRLQKKYAPQGGFAATAFNLFKNEAQEAIYANQDLIMKEVEDLILLYIRIKDCKSWKGVMANIVSDVKKRFDVSLSGVVLQCIDDIFKIADQKDFKNKCAKADELLYDLQFGEVAETQWLQTLRSAYGNWKLATSNEGFHKLSKLMSLLVGAGLVQMSSLSVDVAGLQLFSELSVPKHVSAYDLADAALATVVYFVEGGYECVCTGSLKPLLYGEHEMRKFDEDYLRCSHYSDYARPGNLALLSIDENDLAGLYSDTLDLGKRLMRTTKSALVKKHIQDRLVRLQDMQSKFTQFRQSGNMREKPYCIGIFGASSVGKSSIGPLLMTSLLHFNGYKADDESIIVLNEHDKYMSNYKTSINGVFLDDVGNTVAEFVETAPTTRILELVNNVKMYANMAEAELKGKVSIQPKAVVCTTNVKDFCATKYSNEPVSIVRRANYIITVTVRPEFSTNNMLDENKVYEKYGDEIPQIPDLWTFHVEKAYPIKNSTKGGKDTIGWRTYVWNGVTMKDIDIKTLMRFTNLDSQRHFANQKKLVGQTANLSEKLQFCEKCRSHVDICVCEDSTHNVDYIDSEYPKDDNFHQKEKKKAKQKKHSHGTVKRTGPSEKLLEDSLMKEEYGYVPHAGPFELFTWEDLTTRLNTMVDGRFSFISNLPGRYFSNRLIRLLFAWFYSTVPTYVVIAHLLLPLFGLLLLFSICPISQVTICSFGVFSTLSCIYTWRSETELLLEAMSTTRTGDTTVAMERRKKIAYVLGGCVLLSGLYAFANSIRRKRNLLYFSQGMMHPTQQEIDDRDANDLTQTLAEELNWANVHVSQLPVSAKSSTTSIQQLKDMVPKNLTFMSYEKDGKNYACDAFFVCANVAIIPKHSWKDDNMLCKFTRRSTKLVNGSFRAFVSRAHSVDIPEMDASLVWIPNSGTWRDLRDYFPQEYPIGAVASEFIWKNHEGELVKSRTLAKPQDVSNTKSKFKGALYTLTIPTKVGYCMAPLIAETKQPYFLGFHLGGITNTPKGCCGTILRSQIDEAIEQLESLPGVIVGMSEGTMEGEKYGIQFFESNTIHEKSPLRKLPMRGEDPPRLEIFGSCTGRVTYYSDVVTSCISKYVASICGVCNKWGKPKFNQGDPWLASLEHSSHPSIGIEGDVLSKAYEDYIKPFYQLLNGDFKALRDATRPLTKMEIVCGIDGKKFIDKMPPTTSVGYPLSGAKKKFLTYLDPAAFEGFNCPAELDEVFWTEFDKAISAYKRGERYYPTFKACLKDEPTKKDKDKVRVFQAAPMVLQMLTRKYFLPVARILSLFPALSECAVGVNCMGPDWSELGDHMKYYGEDRILAGDYSKYDLRMPAQVMFAAFRVLIDIAIICGYSDEDITIMRGIATDICYPVMAYNGDLVQMIGSNPSGQNMTVYINSVVNSLLFRSAFFAQQGLKSHLDFRNVCKLMTYGDDVKGSVKEGFDEFNHLYVADYFAQHDMKFTMPDKESDPVPFMKDTDADFLKRKNVYCPELGRTMGALDEDSIFKSLHSNLKSKANTREKLAADNIDGALREWFNHGRDIYELRREQMKQVAQKADISHMCKLLDCDFDSRVEKWRERYEQGILMEDFPEPTVDFEDQSGEYMPECFVERIVPVIDSAGTIVSSFQVINCTYNSFLDRHYLSIIVISWTVMMAATIYGCIRRSLESRVTYVPQMASTHVHSIFHPRTWEEFRTQYVLRRIHENAVHAAAA